MAKTKISEYSATAGSNTDINNINLAEGMAPSLVNNAIRQLMAQLKDFQVGTAGDNVTVGGNLAVTGTSAFTGAISAPMTAGTIDGVPIGGTTTAAGAFTTLAASGTTTLAGALVGAVTQAAFNTTTTTLNLGGAATAVNIGAATGTATVANTTLAAKAITASTTLAVTGTSTLTGAVTATAGVTGPITSSNVAITGGSIAGITDLAVADGGTGASTAQAALNNLLPSQASANTKYLQSDGTNASWDAIAVNTSDITGVLAVANGGTATSSPSLVQGTNVTITGTWPNQTISAVGTGFGDVVGPSSATDNAITRYDGTTGKLVQTSLVTVADDGAITAPQVGSVIPFYYANQAAFPSASTYHGALAHSHADAAMYFAHGSVWTRLLDGAYTTTATAGGTTTLTVSSAAAQFFTGTSAQTIVLPVASTLVLGQTFSIHNNSTSDLTVNSSGSNLVATVTANTTCLITCILTSGTSAASFDADFTGFTSTLPIARGGTGASTLAGANIPVVNVANTFTATQTFAGSSSVLAEVLSNAAEVATVEATAATGTINYDITTQSVRYFTSNASANWTVNFRASSGTSLNTAMSTGQSVTAAFLVTQGSTAYYNSVVQVDGTTVTPKYQGGTAYAAGNASAVDVYMYTIVKTGNAAFTVFTSQTKFA